MPVKHFFFTSRPNQRVTNGNQVEFRYSQPLTGGQTKVEGAEEQRLNELSRLMYYVLWNVQLET